MKKNNNPDLVDPARIMQIGMGFWASKILLAAVDFDIFTLLASGPKEIGFRKTDLLLLTGPTSAAIAYK